MPPGDDKRPPRRLLDRVREVLALRHYSPRTARSYVHWIRRFIVHQGRRHPETMGASEVTAFLTHLAVELGLSASSQNQALNAIAFLYDKVLGQQLGELDGVIRARRRPRLPVVLTREEVAAVLARLDEPERLIASILYGAGLRLMEGLRLRIKDVDLERRVLIVRGGKGDRDRVSALPESLLGHKDVGTTMIYTHVVQRGAHGVISPLDELAR